MIRNALIALASLVALAPAAVWAEDTYYGVTSLENNTDDTIRYFFKWDRPGEGWELRTLEPHTGRHHSWRYDYPNQNRGPRLLVMFDCDGTSQTRWETRALESYASPTPDERYAKQYEFMINRDEFMLVVAN